MKHPKGQPALPRIISGDPCDLISEMDAVSKLGGKHIIVHLCLNYKFNMEEMCFESAKRNMKEIVDYAKSKGITVCLENLTFGFTCEPDPYLCLIQSSGASANIDIGHACFVL